MRAPNEMVFYLLWISKTRSSFTAGCSLRIASGGNLGRRGWSALSCGRRPWARAV